MNQRLGVLLVGVILFTGAPYAFAAEVLTNDQIIAMTKGGLGDEIILGKIKVSSGQYDLSTTALLRLKSEGVSDAVIKAMLEASGTPATPAPPPTATAAPPRDTGRAEQDAIALYRQEKLTEAVAAFDRLLVERPTDDGLRIWKALALLEQARAMKDAKASGYKPVVMNAYAILQPMGQRQTTNADWNFAMAKAFWLNDRPAWSSRAAGKAIAFRPNFAEPQLLLGDLAYDADVAALSLPSGSPSRDTALRFGGMAARKEYEKALALPDLPAALRAEAHYKLGVVAVEIERKLGTARKHWDDAAAADPTCRYGRMARVKLGATAAP